MHKSMKFWLAAAALAATSIVASSATAQDSPLEKELENYWTVDRDLPVVQDKLFSREGRFGFGLYSGVMSSEPFYWYIPVGGRLTYFLSDHFGLEIGGQYNGSAGEPGPLTQPTEINDFFATRLEEAFDPATDLEDRFLWRANAVALWNPLYGKWSFLNNKLSHFDINLALGAGAVSVLRPNFERTEATSVITPELVLGGGVQFFLGKSWILRGDGRFYVYQGADSASSRADYDPQDQSNVADKSSFFKRLQVPSEFLLGVTYLF